MTREERKDAIANLNMIRVAFIDTVTVEQGKLIDDTFRAAIKALEQEPCGDAISREQAIKQCGFGMTNLLIADCLRKLPSVNPQPKTDEENIHREREQAYLQGYEDACKKYRKEPKTGHWEKGTDEYTYWYKCSVCNTKIPKNEWGNDYFSPYCPECGAKMVEPQESEGKE